MQHRGRFSSSSLIAPMRALLVAAIAVYLLSLVGGWAMGLPVRAAPSIESNGAAPSIESNGAAPSTESNEAAPSTESNEAAPSAEESEAAPAAEATAVVTVPSLNVVSPTATPSATAEPTAQPSAPAGTPASLEYRVREGDTLGAVARAHAVSVEDLIAANGLTDPNLLYVGQTLVIPDGDPVAQPLPPTPVPAQPTPIPPPASPAAVEEERWIDVDLARQRLTAYEGSTPVHTTLVSTGLPATPTPEGQFRIWIKLRYDDMAGADYYIEDVPYVMYFHQGYGLHGVTWHGNFGHPMSHGCVNLPTEEAEWLFNWAEVGTLVNVHG